MEGQGSTSRYGPLIVAVIALVFAIIALVGTIDAKAGEYTYSGSGYIAIESRSGFFNVQWCLQNGEAHFRFDGPSIENATDASSEGSISGAFDVTTEQSRHSFSGVDSGVFASLSELPDGVTTLLTFTGAGVVEKTINAGDLQGDTTGFVWLDAEYFWLFYKDDDPVVEPYWKMKLQAIGFNRNVCRMVVKNVGNQAFAGPVAVDCGLSYYPPGQYRPGPYEWRPTSGTRWDIGHFDYIEVGAKETASLDFFLPEQIPGRAVYWFNRERDERWFRGWWEYPDPPMDCFCFILKFGDTMDAKDWVHGFSPVLNPIR